jgi:hypothetical protein
MKWNDDLYTESGIGLNAILITSSISETRMDHGVIDGQKAERKRIV